MKVDIISLFPEMFLGPLNESILKRAQDKGLLDLSIHNLRDFTKTGIASSMIGLLVGDQEWFSSLSLFSMLWKA